MRNTFQRKIVLDTVKKMRKHPTAEDVYQAIRQEYPHISKATVYRNLYQLAEEGEIRTVLLPDSPVRFDDRVTRHYHFRCKLCGSVFDVDMDYLSGMDETVRDVYGFQVDGHDVIFTGVCPQCAAKKESD